MTGITVRIMDIINTHLIYEIYYQRRHAIKPKWGAREVYGDKQVHVLGVNTYRMPKLVMQRAKPFGKDKETTAKWFYTPNTSIEIILTVFKQAGYEVVETRDGTDQFNDKVTVYMVAKKR